MIKPEHTRDWEEFITKEGLPGVKKEPDTIFWVGSHHSDNKYAITDFFPHEAGRKAHLDGAVAEAVFGHSGKLQKNESFEFFTSSDIDWFAEPPKPMLVEVLANKSGESTFHKQENAGVTCALRVILKAKQDKVC